MGFTYSILHTTVETEESIAGFYGFEDTRSGNRETKITCFVQNKAEDNCCYGIQYVPKQDMKKMKQIFFSQKDKTQYLYTTKEDYSELFLNWDRTGGEESVMELLAAGFYSYMSLKETLLIHASAIAYEGKGLVFTAASGVGKTTQAELWAKYKNARILNGDKVFLKQEEDGIHAWGTPWNGSSCYALNESAKLKAIVVLEQAEENSIHKLNVLESMQYFVPHIFFPCWDERCEQSVLTFLDHVLEETDVYLLKCRPDKTAVELLASVIKE